MPISEKIIKEIEELNVSEDEKQLMLNLLNIEDEGVYQYVSPYEKHIKQYIEDKNS